MAFIESEFEPQYTCRYEIQVKNSNGDWVTFDTYKNSDEALKEHNFLCSIFSIFKRDDSRMVRVETTTLSYKVGDHTSIVPLHQG